MSEREETDGLNDMVDEIYEDEAEEPTEGDPEPEPTEGDPEPAKEPEPGDPEPEPEPAKGEPEKAPEAKGEPEPERTYTEREFNGLLQDKVGETRKRQEAEALAAQVQSELAAFRKGQQTAPSGKKDGDKNPEYDPQEYPTFAETEQVIDARVQKAVAEARQADETGRIEELNNTFNARSAETEEAARSMLTVEACGAGRDFDTVVQRGMRLLTEADHKAIFAVGVEGGDPARAAYDKCLAALTEAASAYAPKPKPSTEKTETEAKGATDKDKPAAQKEKPKPAPKSEESESDPSNESVDDLVDRLFDEDE